MSFKLAINGFGRIGRNAFKIAFSHPEIEIVAINDLTDTKTLAHLLKHDSNYGLYHQEISYDEQNLIVGGRTIRITAEKDPLALPWRDMGIDVVIESTGRFTKAEDAGKHLQAGAKRVVISAPGKGDGVGTYVIGVNDDKLTAADTIVSNASCTTNCITPVAAVIEAAFGIEKAMMTTIHSYTASQALQDAPNKDLREGRNAAENIVPTTTGAALAAALALPSLKGVFDGLSIRVPTPVVSLSDFTFLLKRDVTVEEINTAITEAVKSPRFQGIIDATDEELVSSDFIGNSHSCIVDLRLTNVVGGNLAKVVAWYDNEWGYSNRLVEQVILVGKTIDQGLPAEAPALTPAAVVEPTSADATSEVVEPVPAVEAVPETVVEPEPAAVAAPEANLLQHDNLPEPEGFASPAGPDPLDEPEPAAAVPVQVVVNPTPAPMDAIQPPATPVDHA